MEQIVPYKGVYPQIDKSAFIAPTALIIGDVQIGSHASIWYGTVIRGDIEPIRIGENTNIQDNCTLHTEKGFATILGCSISVGHNAVVHGGTIEDGCLIGIGAIVLNGAVVRRNSVVAAGSLVKEKQSVGPYQLVAGSPAKVKKQLTEEMMAPYRRAADNYLAHAAGHRQIPFDSDCQE